MSFSRATSSTRQLFQSISNRSHGCRTLSNLARPAVNFSNRSVEVTFPNGEVTSFHHVWLRDHCREERSRHPTTKQRLVDTAKIPKDIEPSNVEATADGIIVDWLPEISTSTATPYRSFYPYQFLHKYSYAPALEKVSKKDSNRKEHWDSKIGSQQPTVKYDQVMKSEKGVWEWVKQIDRYGFCFVEGIPPTPEATEELIRRISFIRETHYGGFWDFTADLSHGDLAYSDAELRAHTDTTYFSDPCGLQLFHLLSPSTSHTGGHNLLVDGFRAAAIFKKSHPHLYDLFSTLPIPTHASGTGSSSSSSGVFIKPLISQPVFTHLNEELIQIRWNGDDRDTVGGPDWDGKMENWFEGVRIWEEIIRSDSAQLWTKMEMGTAIIFDNHRVLHGRSAFIGERRLCGAYISGDDYRSRLEGLRLQFDK